MNMSSACGQFEGARQLGWQEGRDKSDMDDMTDCRRCEGATDKLKVVYGHVDTPRDTAGWQGSDTLISQCYVLYTIATL